MATYTSTWETWTNDSSTDASSSISYYNDTIYYTTGTAWYSWNCDGNWEEVAIQPQNDNKEAEEKAKQTLLDTLTDEQLEVFERIEAVPVTAFKSGNKYLIKKGRAGNIEVLDKNGGVKHRLCFHPQICCPDYDTMLAQKLMLEMAEKEVLQIANVH